MTTVPPPVARRPRIERDHPTRRHLLGRAAVLLPLALGGCLQQLAGEPPRRFRLNPPSVFPPNLPTVDWVLEVDQTVADAGIDNSRIAHLSGLELLYYPNAEWASSAPEMINQLLVQSFFDSGKIIRVGDRNSGLRPDFVLKTMLRDFEAEGAGPPSAKIVMTSSLVRMPRRVQVGAERFQASTPAASGSTEDIVLAFQTALDRVVKDLLAWTLTTGTSAPSGNAG